jgi:hypothetical protein
MTLEGIFGGSYITLALDRASTDAKPSLVEQRSWMQTDGGRGGGNRLLKRSNEKCFRDHVINAKR